MEAIKQQQTPFSPVGMQVLNYLTDRVSKEQGIPTMLFLKHINGFDKMWEWCKDHPNANEAQILDKVDDLIDAF